MGTIFEGLESSNNYGIRLYPGCSTFVWGELQFKAKVFEPWIALIN